MRTYFSRRPEIISLLALLAAVLLIGGLTSDSSQSQDTQVTSTSTLSFRGVFDPVLEVTPALGVRSRLNISDESYRLAWPRVDDATWYRLHIIRKNGKVLLKEKISPAHFTCSDSVCEFDLRNLNVNIRPDREYFWWVVAKTTAGAKVKSDVIRFTVRSLGPVPTGTPANEVSSNIFSSSLLRVSDNEEIEIIPFGDTALLRAELLDPATKIIYLMPDEEETEFVVDFEVINGIQDDKTLVFNHDVIVYGNNAVFTTPVYPVFTGRKSALFAIAGGATVELHHIHIKDVKNYDGYGAGITNSGTLSIFDSTFVDNYSYNGGAGIINQDGELNLYRSTFHSNVSGGGAAIQNERGGLINVECSRFTENAADYGAAIVNGETDNETSQIKIRYSAFEGNIAFFNGSTEDIHNLQPNSVMSVDARLNWWGGDGVASVSTSNVIVEDEDHETLDDDPTIAPYTDYPQCQPRLPRLVSEEAVPFHVYAEEFGLPMPFDQLPYNIQQTGQPGDPLNWNNDLLAVNVQGFGPTRFAQNHKSLYRWTFAIHSGLDYGPSLAWQGRILVSVCDGVVVEGNNVTGTYETGGSAQPGRGVSIRCFVESLDSAHVDVATDPDSDPNLSNIIVTYNHMLFGGEIDCNYIQSGCSTYDAVAFPTVGQIVHKGDILGQTGYIDDNNPDDHLHFSAHFARGFTRRLGMTSDNAFYINPLLLFTSNLASQHEFQAYASDELGIAPGDLHHWSAGGFNSAPNGTNTVDAHLSFWTAQTELPEGPGHVEWPFGKYPLIPSNDPALITEFVEYATSSFTAFPYAGRNCVVLPIDPPVCDQTDLSDESPYQNVPHPYDN